MTTPPGTSALPGPSMPRIRPRRSHLSADLRRRGNPTSTLPAIVGAYTGSNSLAGGRKLISPAWARTSLTTTGAGGPGRSGNSGMELVHDRGRDCRRQRRHQHDVCDSGLAAGHQHVVQHGLDHAPQYSRRVALTGDDIWVLCSGQSIGGVGRVRVARPRRCGRAFTALATNQRGAINAEPSVGFLNPALYAIGKGTNYAACFHDITTGNNTNTSTTAEFFAVPGFDLCTGWGTPTGSNLIYALAPFQHVPHHAGGGFCIGRSAGQPIQHNQRRFFR